ncbi:FliM/FliN family flagellar motor switch protein [uncultured Erythrobacter sp.]|uniref:FliM/FliN family flagellar motor switch protein n=1 Tax=uncultured Erythrobacter sp. TaxID=263913 RepID=UPI0026234BAC|nr:FliM/FliN family flagellar motor switch protein [uncultured Erythrobacter sp.]
MTQDSENTPEKEGSKTPGNNAKSTDPVELVDHVSVDCEALLGSGEMTIGQLSKLSKGDVITLNRTPVDPVDIRVNGKTIARGEIVTVDDRFAIRLTEIG